MSDPYPVTETIMDADGLDAEAFARLYHEYVMCETVFGRVPMEVDDADAELTVTIHDPMDMIADPDDDDVQHLGGSDRAVSGGYGLFSDRKPDLSRFDGHETTRK